MSAEDLIHDQELDNILAIDFKDLATIDSLDPVFNILKKEIIEPSVKNPVESLYEKTRQTEAFKSLESKWIREDLQSHQPLGIALQKNLTQCAHNERLPVYKTNLLKQYEKAIGVTKEFYDQICLGELSNNANLKNFVSDWVDAFAKDRHLLLTFALSKHSFTAPTLPQHAFNVCLLSIATATALQYSRAQIIDIGQGALLADIGMLAVPEAILNKNGKLTSEELYEIHKHPITGYGLIKKIQGLTEIIFSVVYQHHERLSGAGYPHQRSSKQIPPTARIISITDTLAAMIHKRSHREALTPATALDRVSKMGQMNLLDGTLIQGLTKYIGTYPLGSYIKLASQKVGKVVGVFEEDPAKPLIAILINEKGVSLQGKPMGLVNLLKESNEKIIEALDSSKFPFQVLDGF